MQILIRLNTISVAASKKTQLKDEKQQIKIPPFYETKTPITAHHHNPEGII